MRTQIRSQLIKAFFIIIAVFFATSVSVITIHFVLVQNYKNVLNKLITEYSLSDTTSNLITDYNLFFKNPSSENRQQYDVNVQKIIDFLKNLDTEITNPQSKTDYEGLKNTINSVLVETDQGIQSVLNNDISGTSAHYNEANKKYLFVKDNSATLIIDELKNAQQLQQKIQIFYLLGLIAMILILFLAVGGALAFSVSFAKKITKPIIKLSEVSSTIAKGQIDIDVGEDLLKESNEIGVLAKSFNEMLISLRTNINNLNKANDKLGIKNQELEHLNDILEGLKLKTEFLQIINHQLRTPISAMRGYLEFWRTGKYKNFPPAKQEEMKTNIIIASDQLAGIINSMVDALELETEKKEIKVDLRKINIKQLVEEIYEVDFERQFKVNKTSFEINSEKEPEILSDKNFLSTIISNLLDNALKYTHNGKVKVGLNFENDYAIIRIEDTGIGLSESDKAILFQKFARGEEAIKVSPTGSGLGMFITRKMVEVLHGEITVESEGRNKGSTFIIKIPNYKSNENN